ncbi:MAG: type II toxin-antitoxin system VapC family toxin [Chloroflexota bacterium]
MSFFVDTNVIIYSAVESEYRSPCVEILEAIARGQAPGQTSSAVLEEVWHLELSAKLGDVRGLAQHAYALFTPLLPVTDEAFRLALSIPGRPGVGTNDRVHAGTCFAHGIRTMVSADRGFDGLPDLLRVDPLDSAARRSLLARR